MGKKIMRLTESDLVRLVKRVVKEQSEESPKFKHRLGWKFDTDKEHWYDEGDRPVKDSDDFDDYDEEMEFGPDDYEEFMNQTKGFKNKWNPSFSKHYYDRYTNDSPLKLRRKSY
jgi:hypothetical protein